MTNRERLSGPDNAWRRMGKSDNLTTITGVITFTEEMGYDELCAKLESRLLRFDRFKQHIGGRSRNVRRPYWVLNDDIDIESHVQTVSLPEPKDKATLQEFVGTLMSRPLDERQPLWQIYHLSEYEDGSAIVVRLNHSMADGFALLYVLFGLADDPDGIRFPIGGLSTPPLPTNETTGAIADNTAGSDSTGDSTDSDSTQAISGEEAGVDQLSSTFSDSNAEDSSRTSGILDKCKLAGRTAKTALQLLLLSEEPDTSLRGEIGTEKRAAWSKEMDVEAVKAVGRQHDATINDVLLAATAGVFRRTLESRGEDVENLTMRCTVPVNLKPMETRDQSLGNYFGLAFVPVPVSERSLGDRIELIRRETSREQLGTEAFIVYQLIKLGGIVPAPVFTQALKLFEGNATAVVSNVPGPMDSISIAGKEVDKIMFWNPQANDQGLSVSIFTYNGGVRVGISGDVNLVPDPTELTAAFEAEIAEIIDTHS